MSCGTHPSEEARPTPRPCSHLPTCPGCPRYGVPGIAPPLRARLEALAAELGATAPRQVLGPRSGFRHRARLAVRGRSGSPKVGLFQAGSHRIADVPRCPIHHPLINDVAAALKRQARILGIRPYADLPHRGDLRSLQVVVERESQRAQVVLVENAETPGPVLGLASALTGELGDRLHSLHWNGNPARTNTILGPHWQRLLGEQTVTERLGGAAVHYPPGAFGQSNLPLFERVVRTVHGWVPDGARVNELYAGCGAIGLGLLLRDCRVTFNERAPDSLGGLARGLAALPEALRSRATLLPGAAGEVADALPAADVVIVDPPRRGLDPELLAQLVRDPPATLIALSCGLDAFEREARALVAGGRTALRELVAFDLFPYTEHVETAARFERLPC